MRLNSVPSFHRLIQSSNNMLSQSGAIILVPLYSLRNWGSSRPKYSKKMKLNVKKKRNWGSKLKVTWDVTSNKRYSLGNNGSSPVRPDPFQQHQELGRCLTTDSWPSALRTDLGCHPSLFSSLAYFMALGLWVWSPPPGSLLGTFHFVLSIVAKQSTPNVSTENNLYYAPGFRGLAFGEGPAGGPLLCTVTRGLSQDDSNGQGRLWGLGAEIIQSCSVPTQQSHVAIKIN